jgi:branched-chain amino acid transport system ATP-binding protein
MKMILKLDNVVKSFSGLVAVRDLSFEMRERSIHALIGPNGSGKTTTVNMITGVFPTTSGEIFYQDARISGRPTHVIARLGIGRTFQNLKLFGSMSVLENMMVGGHQLTHLGIVGFILSFGGAGREEKSLKEKAEEVLNFIGLYDVKSENVRSLPYGKQKMVELGRALMTAPKLLLLDEPAAGLNASERKEFVDIILKTFATGIDIFLIEHNMDVVMNMSDRITVLDFGAKIAEGPPAEIRNNNEVIKAYLGDKFRTN